MAMDGAASVITVVTFALSSAQIILKAVSGIKNAPDTIKQLAAHVLNLSNLLKQLEECSDSLHLATELPALIKECAQDLRGIQEKLDKTASKCTNRAGKWSNDLIIMLQGKEWDKKFALIQQHYQVLSLQVNIIEGKRGSTQTASLERIESLSNKQLALNTSTSIVLDRTTRAVDQIQTIVPSIGAASQKSNQDTIEALRGLGDDLQNLSGSSSEQSNALDVILKLLEQRLPAKHQESAIHPVQSEAITNSDDVEMIDRVHESLNDEDLHNAINRLRCLAGEKEKTMFSAEAETIIHDIEAILLSSLHAEKDDESREGMKRKRRRIPSKNDEDEDDLQYRGEIKRMKGQVTASRCIAVNDKVSRAGAVPSGNNESENIHCCRNSRNGIFTVQARRKYRTVLDDTRSSSKNSRDDLLETLDASMAFLSKPNATRIAIDFKQRVFYAGSFLSTPILSVSILLPKDSEAFNLIKSGDLKGLIKSLTLKKTRLTDRDLQGRCLLNYAINSLKPDICKFLIDEGADVDFIESMHHVSEGGLAHSLQIRGSSDNAHSPEDLALHNQCRKYMLEAGADPALKSASGISFMDGAVFEGMSESIRTLLDFGGEFMFVDSGFAFHSSILNLVRCRNWSLDSINLLVRQGAHLKLRCDEISDLLHTAFRGSSMETQDGLRDALILFIQLGADVYSLDSKGRSIADKACNPQTVWLLRTTRMHESPGEWPESDRNRDLQLRRIWKEALIATGYDAEDVIQKSLHAGISPENSDDDDVLSVEEAESIIEGDIYGDEDIDGNGHDCIDQEAGDFTSHCQDEEIALENDNDRGNYEGDIASSQPENTSPWPQTNSVFNGHHDWSVLEEDINVWRSRCGG